MSNEGHMLAQMYIKKGSLEYRSLPNSFYFNVTGTKGPVPGALTVTVAGVNVDFGELTTPGMCRLANLETAGGNWFEYGIWDPESVTFFPLGEVLAGETFPLRLSRNLQEQLGTGTGTTGAGTNRLRLKAWGGTVRALVEAFEV